MRLRPYQEESIIDARKSLKKNRAIIIQAPTGTGKTVVMTAIANMVIGNNKRAWIIVPRTELITQTSDHLRKWNVSHGIIDPRHNESRAYKVHVISKDTLLRRLNKIKIHPDLIIIDECHIADIQQKKISDQFPKSKIIGYTATCERGDGRGLSVKSGGIYEDLVLGKSIPWLTERGYLTPAKYFAPPIDGLGNLHKKGTDYDAKELDQLFKKRKIYGEAIEHYRKLGNEKPALIFCRDVKSAYETAERFSANGYKFFCIEGKMSGGKRRALINALRDGEIHGLTSVDILTYGFDCPRVEVGICLRPTFSRALYFQMFGRTIRPYETNNYKKEYSVFIDHVDNWREHTDPEHPDTLPFDLENINWNFHGVEKRKRTTKDILPSLKVCPECFMYFSGNKCTHCGAMARKRESKKELQVDGQLVEIKQKKLNERPLEERREIVDTMNSYIEQFETDSKFGKINSGAVGEMIKLSEKLGYSIMWVYWKLAPNNSMVNVTLLHEIARQKDFKRGWAWHKQTEIKNKLEKDRKDLESYYGSVG